MELKPESTTVTLCSQELTVSPDQVARYAGGSRYRMDDSQLKLVRGILAKAYQLIAPAFVYQGHSIAGRGAEGAVKLHNGMFFPVPEVEQDSGMGSLVFCVCTIGSRLEEEATALMTAGDSLASLFLDAAGVAFLEALSARAQETLQKRAQERLLHCGCRFGPGYGGLELSYQKELFALVDASLIGVRLMESGVMSPAKSLSFVTTWTTSPAPRRNPYKCSSCNLSDCLYRL